MSHKTAKAVRRTLRTFSDDPREVVLVPSKPIALPQFNGSFLGQRSLKPTCGRAIYREAKKSLRV